MAEGGGLLNRYRVKSSIGGSNPPLSARDYPISFKIFNLLIRQAVTLAGAPTKYVQIVHILHSLRLLNPENPIILQRKGPPNSRIISAKAQFGFSALSD